ncbi:hypothetical protein GWG65_06390 [Bradyrhizobium sp. CSA207]|uniref:PD-(D/E)XK nuclease family protein n=1 Tax=Bradyrhizobium sp. CSA207 TaxID=2698826 RepID=UPI0023B01734|nr:PD-(D/E)XK nuclease family protein [Bradyrhizobium sp. CSA207]MDE5441090.1 hypothetical protein [Bradyrhizobium sp. CSA207]
MSECLADFFNRLPHEAKVSFVQETFVPSVCASEWRSSISDAATIHMKTQYQIPNGRLDIVILLDNQPTFVIENKVGAPIGKRSNNIDQLRVYGDWLKQMAVRSGQKLAVLCLLTHVTSPPETFKEDQRDLYGSTPKVVRWSQIAAEVQAIAREGGLPLDIRTIAREFHLFLLEQNMTTEFARFEDFAAAIVYVRSGSRISHTFEKIYDHLSELGGPFVKGFSKDDAIVDFDSEGSVIHGWKYLSAAPLKSAYFAYGINLQPRRSLSIDSLPDEDSIFLAVGVETKKEMQLLEARSKDFGQDWHYLSFSDYSLIVTFRPLHAALSQPEEFAGTMIAWIDQSYAAVVAKLIQSLQKQYGV